LKLLKELEALKLLRLIKQKEVIDQTLSEKYAGKLSFDIAEKIQDHIQKSRNEWNNNI
jgi:hypothetical protein